MNLTIRKWLTFTICFVLLMSGSACQKKTPETGANKEYSNAFFTCRHPKDWRISENANQLNMIGPEELGYYVNVKIDYNNNIGMNLEDFRTTVETQNNLSALPQFKDMGQNQIKIGDQPALQHNIITAVQAVNSPLFLYVKLIYLVKNNQLGIVITAEIPQDSLGKYENLVNEVIQSFRFK